MTTMNETEADGDEAVAEANLARLAMRDLEATMNRLIEVDGRALSLAARAGQLFLDGKVPEHRQEELVTAMEQVVNTSLEVRTVIQDVSRMVSVTKAGSEAGTVGSAPAAADDADDRPASGDDTAESPGEQQRRAVIRQRRLAKMRL